MGQVIQLHQTRPAKAAGVFAQINCAARNLGYSDHLAYKAAVEAKKQYLKGGASAARVVSIARADLRQKAARVLA